MEKEDSRFPTIIEGHVVNTHVMCRTAILKKCLLVPDGNRALNLDHQDTQIVQLLRWLNKGYICKAIRFQQKSLIKIHDHSRYTLIIGASCYSLEGRGLYTYVTFTPHYKSMYLNGQSVRMVFSRLVVVRRLRVVHICNLHSQCWSCKSMVRMSPWSPGHYIRKWESSTSLQFYQMA